MLAQRRFATPPARSLQPAPAPAAGGARLSGRAGGVDTVRLLRDYLAWERQPVLRRRAQAIVRRTGSHTGMRRPDERCLELVVPGGRRPRHPGDPERLSGRVERPDRPDRRPHGADGGHRGRGSRVRSHRVRLADRGRLQRQRPARPHAGRARVRRPVPSGRAGIDVPGGRGAAGDPGGAVRQPHHAGPGEAAGQDRGGPAEPGLHRHVQPGRHQRAGREPRSSSARRKTRSTNSSGPEGDRNACR